MTCVLNGVITSNPSISFGRIFCMIFCSIHLLVTLHFVTCSFKPPLEAGNVYLLSVLPALKRRERQHLFPWLFRKTFEKCICTYKGQGRERVRMLILFASEYKCFSSKVCCHSTYTCHCVKGRYQASQYTQ